MDRRKLKDIREGLGLTRTAFATELGVARSVYSRYESGDVPIPKYIAKLVRLYIGEEDQADLVDRISELEEENRYLRSTLIKITEDAQAGQQGPTKKRRSK